MTTRTSASRASLASLRDSRSSPLAASSGAATVPAKLRVLTPTKVLDPGTTYIVDQRRHRPDHARRRLLRRPRRLRAPSTRYDKPNALSLLATAGADHQAGRARSRSPTSSASASGSAGSAAQQASSGESFWYFKVEPRGGLGRRRPARDQDGRRGALLPRARRLPEPEPGRARAQGAGRARRRAQPFSVAGDRAHVRHRPDDVRGQLQQRAGRRRHRQRRRPATRPRVPTARPQITVADAGDAELAATRGTDIPSEVLDTCVGPQLELVPEAARRAHRRQPERRQDQGHLGRRRDPLARRRRHGSTLRKGGADTRQLRPRARTSSWSSARPPSDGLVIKGNCETR